MSAEPGEGSDTRGFASEKKGKRCGGRVRAGMCTKGCVEKKKWCRILKFY